MTVRVGETIVGGQRALNAHMRSLVRFLTDWQKASPWKCNVCKRRQARCVFCGAEARHFLCLAEPEIAGTVPEIHLCDTHIAPFQVANEYGEERDYTEVGAYSETEDCPGCESWGR